MPSLPLLEITAARAAVLVYGTDTQQIGSVKKPHDKKGHRKSKQSEAETPKSRKDAAPYDEKARKKEKETASAAAAIVLADMGIDRKRDNVAPAVKDKTEDQLEKAKPKEKKEKKRETSSDNAVRTLPAPGNEDQKSKSKTGKKIVLAASGVTTSATESTAAPENLNRNVKKSKKRKHAGSLPVDGEPTPSTPDVAGESHRPKKKKRSGDPKIIDPSDDKSLSGQALKALSYAFLQYENPAEWKFNKARQNWLIRNIWSPEMIPDKHLPLLANYLKNVKGGVRDALIKTCQIHLRQPDVQTEDRQAADEQTGPEATPAPLFSLSVGILSDNIQEIKRRRAEVVLDTLEAL